MRLNLTQGQSILVDDADYPRIRGYSWHAALMMGGKWRVVTTLPGRPARKLHLPRLLLSASPGQFVDHVNGDTLDNRRANLRLCTNAENQQNTGPRGGTSRYKGVSWFARRGVWRAAFNHNGRTHFVGYFTDEAEAARAYDARVSELAGPFARLNFPGVSR